MKTVTVKIKTAYGVERIYPVCSYAKLFADIAGTDTLTIENIERIKKLGYTVQLEISESPLAAALIAGS